MEYGSVRRRPGRCGLERGLLDRAAGITAARERSESLFRYSDGIAHVQTSLAPPPEPNRARFVIQITRHLQDVEEDTVWQLQNLNVEGY